MRLSNTYRKRITGVVSAALGMAILLSTSLPISQTAFALPGDPLPHAPLPAYENGYPKPTIIVNTTAGGSDLVPWFTSTVVPLLRDWYPVIGDRVIGGGYTCLPEVPCDTYPLMNTMTLKATTITGGNVMRFVAPNTIEFDVAWVRANQANSFGTFIHEMTHVAQQYTSAPFWLQEGVADYIRIHVYQDYNPALNPNASYLNGYADAGHFINYMDSIYPRYVEKMSLAARKAPPYSPSQTTTVTGGVSLETLWKNFTTHSITTINNMKPGNATTRCIDLPNFATAEGTRPDIWDCVPQENERWVARDQDTAAGGVIQGYYGAKCLSVNTAIASNGGFAVDYRSCNVADVKQKFLRRADTTVYNANTNKCLRPAAAASANGTKLEVVTCNATQTAQKWTWSLAI